MKRETLARSLSVAALFLLAAGVLPACNTMKGLGKDVEAAGSGMSKGAEKASDAMFDDDGEKK